MYASDHEQNLNKIFFNEFYLLYESLFHVVSSEWRDKKYYCIFSKPTGLPKKWLLISSQKLGTDQLKWRGKIGHQELFTFSL